MNIKGSKIPYIIIAVLFVVVAILFVYVLRFGNFLNQSTTFEETDTLLSNPLIGFAPSAENEEACEDSQLVFISLTWADWEPQEGVFDIDGLEARCHLDRWDASGKHAVLRFACDVPGDEDHMDIPEWLYAQTGDGVAYDTSYGKGYSPNYENTVFREAHHRAIVALAEYCNGNDYTGIAPMYWDWPVTVYVYDLDGELIYWDNVDLELSELVPGTQIMTENEIPYGDFMTEGFRVGVGITDPDEENHIMLAMDSEVLDDGIQVIYTFEN